jgi:hypothetical protein
MKVALLLFGQPRNFSNMKVFESHKKFFIERYETDIFCHCWKKTGGGYSVSNWSNAEMKKVTSQEDECDLVLSCYKPVSYKVEEQKDFQNIEMYKNGPFGKFPWYERNLPNILSQLYSINKVSELFEEYTSKNEKKYDMVVMVRYDLVVKEFPDISEFDKNFFWISDSHPRFPDLFFIFDPKFLDSQKTYQNYELIYRKMISRELGFDRGKGINSKRGSYWEPSVECFKYNNYLLYFDRSLIRTFKLKEERS